MNYTCPKCGKKMELSTKVLINSEYKVICPQCLSELHIVGDYAYIPQESLELDTSVQPSRTINCPSCGHMASSNAHFCPNCGASFDTLTAVEDVIPEEVTGDTMPSPATPGNDPLYNEAIQFLMQCTAITPMMLRDRFHISDERAAQLIRQLEAGGIIGPYNNGGPRQILIPHRSIYNRMPQQNPMQGNTPPQGQAGPQPRRFGCLTMALKMVFFVYLMKACGM